jgi:uncharacterized protein YegJ (DUF2314 family)
MRTTKIILGFVLLTYALLAVPQPRDENEVVFAGTTDPDMLTAIKNARARLPEFLKLAENPPAGTAGYKLKVMVNDGNTTEHFWVTPFKVIPNGYAGIIANEPKVVKNVKFDQLVRFDQSLISDWGYTKDGRQVGSFTICVLFKKMPVEQAEYYRKNHGFDC